MHRQGIEPGASVSSIAVLQPTKLPFTVYEGKSKIIRTFIVFMYL